MKSYLRSSIALGLLFFTLPTFAMEAQKQEVEKLNFLICPVSKNRTVVEVEAKCISLSNSLSSLAKLGTVDVTVTASTTEKGAPLIEQVMKSLFVSDAKKIKNLHLCLPLFKGSIALLQEGLKTLENLEFLHIGSCFQDMDLFRGVIQALPLSHLPELLLEDASNITDLKVIEVKCNIFFSALNEKSELRKLLLAFGLISRTYDLHQYFRDMIGGIFDDEINTLETATRDKIKAAIGQYPNTLVCKIQIPNHIK